MKTLGGSGSPKNALVPLLALVALVISACGGSTSSSAQASGTPSVGPVSSPAATAAASSAAPASKLKVAFVYLPNLTPAESWNSSLLLAQQAVEKTLADQVEVSQVENVPEGPASLKTFEDLARQGFKVIFGTTFGYMDQMLEVAGKYPDAVFLNAAGYKVANNMGNYYGAEEQARYLEGMIAGGMSKSGKIGYVAAFPIPLVLRGVNAFTLGAQKVNPSATVSVVWTSNWFDPNAEKQAAAALLRTGIDVVSNETDSPGTGQAAEEAGAYWLGSYADQSSFAPTAWLASQCWDWAPYSVDQVKKVLDKTWKSEAYWGTLANGMVKLCGPSDKVPADLAAKVATAQAAIVDGSLNIWSGPIFDQDGKQVVAQGGTLSDTDQQAMNWLAKGVSGTIPK